MSEQKGICTYCLSPVDEVTIDHVIARSWYPASTPKNLEKWTVPACESCNNRYSKLEDDLLVKIAICLDPKNPEVAEIINRVLRSVDHRAGRDERDKKARENRRKKLIDQIEKIDVDDEKAKSALPFSRKNIVDGKAAIIYVSRGELDTLIQKWCRGLHYLITGRRIPHFVNVDVFHVDDADALDAYKDILRFGEPMLQGTGVIFIRYSATSGARIGTSYAINIWNEFRAYTFFEETNTGSG